MRAGCRRRLPRSTRWTARRHDYATGTPPRRRPDDGLAGGAAAVIALDLAGGGANLVEDPRARVRPGRPLSAVLQDHPATIRDRNADHRRAAPVLRAQCRDGIAAATTQATTRTALSERGIAFGARKNFGSFQAGHRSRVTRDPAVRLATRFSKWFCWFRWLRNAEGHHLGRFSQNSVE